MDLGILRMLSEEPGPSGFESRVVGILRRELEDSVDELIIDNMGNLIARIGDGDLRVILSAHIDEVGIMVTHIDQRGFIRVTPIGGLDPWSMLGKELILMGRKGDVVGIVGIDPPHLRRERPPSRFEELYVDVGASSRDEVMGMGLHPGTPGTFHTKFRESRGYLVGKALDNRLGCAVLVSTLRSINPPGDASLYFVFNTQEEVGLRGINAVVNRINPHIAIVVESTVAADTPGNPEDQWITRIGGGVAIRAMDKSMITSPALLNITMDTAESLGIRYQVQVNPFGGTDAGVIHTHGLGVPTLVLSTPTRYIHTSSSMAHVGDVEQLESLLKPLVHRLVESKGIITGGSGYGR